ncbi:holo-(acyl-carrier protein) synthase, putative [Babesia microti strain RI]|uniref:Holo-(Acyl-carrier protein) synthase, putative n=1 Tax=Babesia microti (strain RI) TaxID=1133968 RepID=A0A1R4AA11_BABMR|nr:holo-(acyl-carrier protein) synthase, putative [Babesia microti strain RI]SJK85848.1 holo-(acyl-carrier protein) synthase, putative [Babesia microti strain RI]|eukprot:XP_021338062.1 holo-(acyl-carrier protein) synthase, putative [Babesia microti strain RI]
MYYYGTLCYKICVNFILCTITTVGQSISVSYVHELKEASRPLWLSRLSKYANASRITNHSSFINYGNICMINKQRVPIDTKLIRKFARNIKRILKIPHVKISIKFVDMDNMRQLYKVHFGKDKSGDIISLRILPKLHHFGTNSPESRRGVDERSGGKLLGHMFMRGKIYICPEYINEQKDIIPSDDVEMLGVAKSVREARDISMKIGYLLVHGILHLIGHDHQRDEDFNNMLKMEDYVISRLNISNNPLV